MLAVTFGRDGPVPVSLRYVVVVMLKWAVLIDAHRSADHLPSGIQPAFNCVYFGFEPVGALDQVVMLVYLFFKLADSVFHQFPVLIIAFMGLLQHRLVGDNRDNDGSYRRD
jgi:hypothetical protein